MKKKNNVLPALRAAFPHTIPILAGFWFLGMAYGFYMHVSGFGVWYTLANTLVIFGGSLEFVTVTMLLAPFAPIQTFLMAFMIQARHLFYGIAMLEKYKGLGWKRFYLIYALCDESFSINCTAEVPEEVDRGWFYFWVSLLNQSYWVLASVTGNLVGNLFTFNTTGLDFVMTAMFVVIFLNQFMKEDKHYTALIGLGSAFICLQLFGSSSFLVPTMICVIVLLTVFRKPIEKAGGLV